MMNQMVKKMKDMSGQELLRKALRKDLDEEETSADEEDKVEYSRQELIDEHKRLIKILESGTEKERKEEAKKQAEELKDLED